MWSGAGELLALQEADLALQEAQKQQELACAIQRPSCAVWELGEAPEELVLPEQAQEQGEVLGGWSLALGAQECELGVLVRPHPPGHAEQVLGIAREQWGLWQRAGDEGQRDQSKGRLHLGGV